MHAAWSTVLLPGLATAWLSVGVAATQTRDCSCGFYDASTQHLFTESTIVYFNESSGLPLEDFAVESYEHKYERDWNAVYRQGAAASNVRLSNSSSFPSLELAVAPPTQDHLVVGGGLRTSRRDIQYGSFRSLMRSPGPRAGGSALSVLVEYNYTQSIELSLQNMEQPIDAWVSMLMHNEGASRDLGVNYTTLSNPSLANHTSSPWDWIEVRVDWTQDAVVYSIGGVRARTVLARDESDFPTVPSPLYIKHWSIGDIYQTQGPPAIASVANVGWVRMFFNSSLMTTPKHEEFDARCHGVDACAVDDMALRGSSIFSPEATLAWEQAKPKTQFRVPALVLISLFMAMTLVLLLNTFLRRITPIKRAGSTKQAWTENTDSLQPSERQHPSGNADLPSQAPTLFEFPQSHTVVDLTVTHLAQGRDSFDLMGSSPIATASTTTLAGPGAAQDARHLGTLAFPPPTYPARNISVTWPIEEEIDKTWQEEGAAPDKASESGLTATTAATGLQPPKKRVEYLAGVIAISSIIVTQIHFYLTFLPAVVKPFAPVHYVSELWAYKIIAPYLLNLSWIGPFLTISTRFLVANYLRDGDLRNVAEKTIGRIPRLLLPIVAAALLEYFLIDWGAINSLQSLPSISWSTWPYAAVYSSFGQFLTEILGLIYLIPNAAPQITTNYCTDVLWTIPVQLQGSWQALLSVIVIREVKAPWKRASYYAFCIINNWYAENWGSYFWVGLILADLDVTFNYKKWISNRAWVHWLSLLLCFVLAAGGLTLDMVAGLTGIPIVTNEHGLHPDYATGLPIAQTANAGYPEYFNPTLNGLIFSVGIHALVDLSPFTQKMLSTKYLMMLFPHTFTIYLIHGFVFWSLGSWVCIRLAALGLPYWLNMLVVAISCYSAIILFLPVLTPAIELIGKNITANIWQAAHEEPAPRRPTLYPFSKTMLLCRNISLPTVSPYSVGSTAKLLNRDAEECDSDNSRELFGDDVEFQDSTDRISKVVEHDSADGITRSRKQDIYKDRKGVVAE
ncbi:hypothetical protein LTR16_000989, partial [Cryomyces antarcticus]